MRQKMLCTFFWITVMFSAQSQVSIGIKFIGLSAHLKRSPHPHLYPGKLDKDGTLVATTGIILTAEYFVYQNILSVKLAQCFLFDCAGKPAGFFHVGLRVSAYHNKWSGSIGNGPTLFFRRDWKDLPGYVDEGLFKRHKNFQYRFFWYAGEVEGNYTLNDRLQFSTTFIPGPPEFFSIAPGIRMAGLIKTGEK